MSTLDQPRPGEPYGDADSGTLVERVFALLQRDILIGVHLPDAKLRIQDLSKRYDTGATPVREALSRLSSLGLVKAIGQRGFRVMPVSRRDLEDIIQTRQVIEIEALRRSIVHGGDDWEAEIVAALHRLRKFTERETSEFREGQAEFDLVHKRFHTALIAACDSPRLLELQGALYDQTYRYRLVMMRSLPQPSEIDHSHVELVDLALARDAGRACTALARHLRLTLENVYPETRLA